MRVKGELPRTFNVDLLLGDVMSVQFSLEVTFMPT